MKRFLVLIVLMFFVSSCSNKDDFSKEILFDMKNESKNTQFFELDSEQYLKSMYELDSDSIDKIKILEDLLITYSYKLFDYNEAKRDYEKIESSKLKKEFLDESKLTELYYEGQLVDGTHIGACYDYGNVVISSILYSKMLKLLEQDVSYGIEAGSYVYCLFNPEVNIYPVEMTINGTFSETWKGFSDQCKIFVNRKDVQEYIDLIKEEYEENISREEEVLDRIELEENALKQVYEEIGNYVNYFPDIELVDFNSLEQPVDDIIDIGRDELKQDSIPEYTISVQNAARINRLASQTSDYLVEAGFNVIEIGNYEEGPIERTIIKTPDEKFGEQLALYFNNPEVFVDATLKDAEIQVIIAVGTNDSKY